MFSVSVLLMYIAFSWLFSPNLCLCCFCDRPSGRSVSTWTNFKYHWEGEGWILFKTWSA